MENLNLQPGDVVRIGDLVVSDVDGAGFGFEDEWSKETRWLPLSLITEVVSRAETPEQRADRVERELTATLIRLNAKEAELEEYRTRKEQTIRKLFTANQELTLRISALEASVVQSASVAATEPKVDTAPWYPPQQPKYGPWIEGPPPLDCVGPFQVLTRDERNRIVDFNPYPCYEAKEWRNAVAHCLKLEKVR